MAPSVRIIMQHTHFVCPSLNSFLLDVYTHAVHYIADPHSTTFSYELCNMKWKYTNSKSLLDILLYCLKATTTREVRVLPQVSRTQEPLHFILCICIRPGRRRLSICIQLPLLVLTSSGPSWPSHPKGLPFLPKRDHRNLPRKNNSLAVCTSNYPSFERMMIWVSFLQSPLFKYWQKDLS